ncbi:hypothetical protein MGH68_01960 [Erysipelothrix sp. D19-032]
MKNYLSGVGVRLTDKDGNTVKDVMGKTVRPQETNSRGQYSFDNLPAESSK